MIVPLLVLMLHFDQRRAAGTSLAAIVPTASIGVLSYALTDSVAWIPALILAGGAVVGRRSARACCPGVAVGAALGFVAFLVLVIASLFIVIPSRGAALEITWYAVLGLVGLGLFTGIVAGLIGVGGGVVVVPALMVLFGTSDLEAKGTSLLMMIPTAVSGTIGNLRHRNVDLVAAGAIGLSACTTTALGAWLATLIDPFAGNMLFAAYLVVIAIQMAIKALRTRPR
ncbi:sulfite exporter TauE/SafE family protein [Microbacterium sp. NIBRBAC000506063]|uniref:sulfite exporter TauE/SafE family protein n=1 Tax=Microbacterium sp. NIBRBAC000506063 TaxID=2734618 RepID=UPI00398070F9